jgi:hypothetical protein
MQIHRHCLYNDGAWNHIRFTGLIHLTIISIKFAKIHSNVSIYSVFLKAIYSYFFLAAAL